MRELETMKTGKCKESFVSNSLMPAYHVLHKHYALDLAFNLIQ